MKLIGNFQLNNYIIRITVNKHLVSGMEKEELNECICCIMNEEVLERVDR